MTTSKISFLIGIIAGIGAFVSFLAESEPAQYILGFATITAFAVSERYESRTHGIKDTDIMD